VGDSDLAQLYTPAITAIDWDLEAVGTAAAEMLLRGIGGGTGPDDAKAAAGREIRLGTRVVLRESCAPPKAA
jgi:LacI family transcriptional regulator